MKRILEVTYNELASCVFDVTLAPEGTCHMLSLIIPQLPSLGDISSDEVILVCAIHSTVTKICLENASAFPSSFHFKIHFTSLKKKKKKIKKIVKENNTDIGIRKRGYYAAFIPLWFVIWEITSNLFTVLLPLALLEHLIGMFYN